MKISLKVGQYIGSVDDNSPASLAGVKAGDRIVEVNGTNISNENHQQVVQRIKAVQNETKLLVVDKDTDEYYRSRKIVIRGDMPNVQRIEAPATRDEVRGSRASSASSNHSGDYSSFVLILYCGSDQLEWPCRFSVVADDFLPNTNP